MGKTVIRVGLPYEPNHDHVYDNYVETLDELYHQKGVKLVFEKFDYETYHVNEQKTRSLPDVFVVDSALLNTNQVSSVIDSVDVKSDSYVKVLNDVVSTGKGIPLFVKSDFALNSASKKFDTLESVVEQNDLKLVYPSGFNFVYNVLQYIKYTGEDKLPLDSSKLNFDVIKVMKALVNKIEVATAGDFYANKNQSVFVGDLQSLMTKEVSKDDTIQLLTVNDKQGVHAEVVVVNKNSKDVKIAQEVAKALGSDEFVEEFISASGRLFVPASVNALKKLAEKNSIYSTVSSLLEKVEEARTISYGSVSVDDVLLAASNVAKYTQRHAISIMRCLASDVVQKANSGHPGMPIGMSPVAYVLWKYFLNVDPEEPLWINRDRFVLSNGHGCVLLYMMLHLAGFKVSMDDLKNFRQMDSITPGHPEFLQTPGVDATTGPLGQGFANSVGMAMAQEHVAARSNADKLVVSDNYTYAFCSDGDLMEGVALEAMAQAGHHKLGKLIVIYDDNKITIDGSTEQAMTEDIYAVAEGYKWHVQKVEHGDSDLVSIKQAIERAQEATDKPSLIGLRTIIGFSSIKENTGKVHGSPLGDDGISKLKELNGFDPKIKFLVSPSVYEEFKQVSVRGKEKYNQWKKVLEQLKTTSPDRFNFFNIVMTGELPEGWEKSLPDFSSEGKLATRQCSQIVLNAIAPAVPNLIGGSADLTGSNLTLPEMTKDFQPDQRDGRYIRFGVREHSMTSIGNGFCYYGGLKPYVATFLIFAGYALGAVRVGALSHLPLIYVLTHDSIGLGEDGPTHQPIEMLPLLRAIPNMIVFRPADGRETSGAYKVALNSKKSPSALALTRQGLPQLEGSTIDSVAKGAYVVYQTNKDKNPDVTLVATGSEVEIAINAAKILSSKNVRVVSFPAWELFETQSAQYKQSIFIEGVPTVSIEASSVQGWSRYSHAQIGMRSFGHSGPYQDVYERFGITKEKAAEKAQELIKKYGDKAPTLNVLCEL